MLNEIKQLIVDAEICKTVDLATDKRPLEGPIDENITPAAYLYFGEVKYLPSDATDGGVHQEVIREFMVQLLVDAADLVDVETQLVKAVMGYTHDNYHLPMEARETKTHTIKGSHYSRLLTFTTELNIIKN